MMRILFPDGRAISLQFPQAPVVGGCTHQDVEIEEVYATVAIVRCRCSYVSLAGIQHSRNTEPVQPAPHVKTQ